MLPQGISHRMLPLFKIPNDFLGIPGEVSFEKPKEGDIILKVGKTKRCHAVDESGRKGFGEVITRVFGTVWVSCSLTKLALAWCLHQERIDLRLIQPFLAAGPSEGPA